MLLFFFMLFLAILRTLFFHVDVKVILSYSKKKHQNFLEFLQEFLYSLTFYIWWELSFFYRGFPHSSVGEECWRSQFDSWVRMICWRDRLLTPVFLGFPCGSAGKEFSCNMGDLSSVPGLGRSSGEGKGYPLQYSGLENSVDCIVHGVTKSHFYVSIPIQDLICLIFVQILFQSVDKILQFSSYGHVPFR